MATKLNNCIVAKAPHKTDASGPSIFLAGSIEMGKAGPWQAELTETLSDLPIVVFNPRREDWNSEWKQTESFGPFNEQVKWEMDHLDQADVIALYFQENTLSPISLLELGLHAKDDPNKLVVCCPDKFWRSGNVQIVCSRYNIERCQTLDELAVLARKRLNTFLQASK
jgi:hypothetical protein